MQKRRSICFLLILFLALHLAGNEAGEKRLSCEYQKQPLRKIIYELSEKYDLNFIFNDAMIDATLITCKVKNEPLHRALKKILKSSPFSCEFINHNTVIIRPARMTMNGRLLKGKVRDSETGAPLADANTYIPGGKAGAATDANGNFSLMIPDSISQLIVSYVGYETKIQEISSRSNVLDILLDPGVFQFNSIRVMAPSYSEEIEQISRAQLNEENFIGVIPNTPAAMTYASFMSYNDNTVYVSQLNNENQFYIKITGNRLHPMLGSDRNNRLAFNQHQVRLNGFQLQMPFHTTIVPAMNPGIVDYDLVQNNHYQTTVFDVDYEDAYESAVDLNYRKGNTEKIRGKAKVDLSNSSLMLEGPLTHRVSWIVHGKKSHMNDFLSALHQSKWMSLNYNDLQTQLDFQASEGHDFRLTAIHSADQIAFDPEINYIRERILYPSSITSSNSPVRIEEHIQEMNFDDNHFYLNAFSLGGVNRLNESWDSEFTFTKAYQQYNNQRSWSVEHNTQFPEVTDSSYYYSYSEGTKGRFKIDSWNEKFLLRCNASENYAMKIGIQFEQSRYRMATQNHFIIRIQDNVSKPSYYNRSCQDAIAINQYAFFYQEERHFGDHFLTEAGIRYDRFSLQSKGKWNPRMIFKYEFPKQIMAKAAYGAFSRLPDYGEMRQHLLEHFEAGFKPEDSKIDFQTIRKTQFGMEKSFSSILFIDVNYFYKDMRNLIPIQRLSDGSLLYDVRNRARAYSNGFDLNIRLNYPAVSLIGRYKYADSHEKTGQGERYPFYMDQKHSLSFSCSAALPKDWQIGFQAIYGSGYAYTPCFLPEYDWDLGYDRDSTPIWEFETDSPNSSRYPAYNRLDLSFKKRFFLPFGRMSLAVNLINVLNTRHTFTYIYTYDQNGDPIRQSESLIPFFPQLEVAYEF